MSSGSRAKRRITRPDVRRGSSVITPARRSREERMSDAKSLSSTSDQLMWWGWGVAIAFVLAGLVWHVFTYQPAPDRNVKPGADQLVECETIQKK